MEFCRDGKPCDTWIIVDGSLVCRHGVVAEASDTTDVKFNCPAELFHEHEQEKWKQFMENLPAILSHFRSLQPKASKDGGTR